MYDDLNPLTRLQHVLLMRKTAAEQERRRETITTFDSELAAIGVTTDGWFAGYDPLVECYTITSNVLGIILYRMHGGFSLVPHDSNYFIRFPYAVATLYDGAVFYERLVECIQSWEETHNVSYDSGLVVVRRR